MSDATPTLTPDPNTKPKRKKGKLIALIAGGVVTLLIGGATIAIASFDPNSLRPAIEAAARQETGRELSLNGGIGLKVSLWPTVELRDVTFANPEGFSRPHMIRLEALELRLGLLPLLSRRVEIAKLALVKPDIALEVNAKGEPNWLITTHGKSAHDGAGGASEKHTESGVFAQVGHAEIQNGAVTYHDSVSGRSVALGVNNLVLSADDRSAPIRVNGDLRVNGQPVTIAAEAGSFERLFNPGGGAYPIGLTVNAAGGSVRVGGGLAEPRRGKGYNVTARVTLPDTAGLGAFWPGLDVPPAKDIAVSARITDTGGPIPALTDISVRAGVMTHPVLAGARIERVAISAPDPSKPITLDLLARFKDMPLTVAGTIGHPGFTSPGGQPIPIDLVLGAGGALVALKGATPEARGFSGLALDLDVMIPALADLSPLAGSPLPALKDIAFKAHFADAEGGLTKGARVTGLALTLPQGDLSGHIDVGIGQPIAVTAKLTSRKIDLDALRALLPAPADPPQPAPGTPARPAATDRLIPDTKLPFDALGLARAEIQLDIDALRFEATDYTALVAHLTLQDSRLRLDPLRATSPDGIGEATLDIDAGQTPPKLHVTLRSPGLRVRPLLEQLGVRPVAAGQIEFRVDLRGTGDTPRAITASLNGSVGIALAGGSIDTKVLGATMGKVTRELPLLELLGRGGGTADIRCLAVRFDATDGIARSRALVFSSSLMSADGGGAVNLRDETLDLRLLPQGRVAATTFRVPVTVKGRLNAPKIDVDTVAAAEANAEKLAGIVIGGATGVGVLGGLLGADQATREGNPCPGALALARFGTEPTPVAAGPSSGEARPPAQPNQPRQQQQRPSNNPFNPLRNLFR